MTLPTRDIAWDVGRALLDLIRTLPEIRGATVSDTEPGDTLRAQHLWLSSITGGELDVHDFTGPGITLPADESFDLAVDVGVFNLGSADATVRRLGVILGAIDHAVRADCTLGDLAGLQWLLPKATPLRRWHTTPEGVHGFGQITLTAQTRLWIP